MSKIETHPLAPFLPKNAKLLMLGSFPPPQSRWKMNFYYPNFQNDMWKIYGLIFFNDPFYFLDVEAKKFKEQSLRAFLEQIGVAIFDTAYQVRRLKDNASDKFLEIVTPTDLTQILEQIPNCCHVMTTGEKATETLIQLMPEETLKPAIGQSIQVYFAGRDLNLHRMPSSSRAYPLALEKKAEFYRTLFKQVRLI